MRGVVMHAPGDVRVEDREQPQIVEPTDAIIEVAAACICGSDLWPYRGLEPADSRPMGHEYVGTVTEVGSAVKNVKPGDFVVGSFCVSDDTCEICRSGYQSRCVNGGFMSDTQAQYTRVPQADGTLVAVPGGRPDDEATVASLLAASDVLGTGWFGAVAAEAGPGETVAVVGDGAVGLMAVLAASQLGADRVIAMSRHEDRAALAREFGATDVVAERGEEGVAEVKDLTGRLGGPGPRTAGRGIPRPRGAARLPSAGRLVEGDLGVGLAGDAVAQVAPDDLDGPEPDRVAEDLGEVLLEGLVPRRGHGAHGRHGHDVEDEP